ncbi:uncharacterized protein LOC105186081 isoform X2 [Harpegnathos saltator]|uniref:uncharacterized protein LOC105186081 isoform X2 n=1 Tax=Harpegnathos saltator TaxID=610380 RepID=UPI000948EC17|nr:uncharacterized protein LOC105186081 isoform X2 [Harpegnathos saltator]
MRSFAVKCIDSLPDRCLEVVSLDIDEIEDHLSKINLTDVPTVKMMAAGFKCPISALPFGALKSDWSRLMLLQEAQPDGSIIKRKLIRIMRVLIIAYYQMEESFDVVKSGAQILQQSQEKEMTTTKVEVTTAKVVPSSSRELNATTRISFVPIEIRIPNVTSPIDLGAVNARYHPVGTLKTAATAVAGNAASRTLDNCLRQSLKDVLSRNRPNRTSHGDVVFERLKGKKYDERAARRRNEINGRAKNADVPAKVSPVVNDLWRYAHFPTEASLNISANAPLYRVRELNGFKTNTWKSWRRVGLNSDGRTRATVNFATPDKNKEKSKSR